jgi:hypothetical protein
MLIPSKKNRRGAPAVIEKILSKDYKIGAHLALHIILRHHQNLSLKITGFTMEKFSAILGYF